jgi:hypothetical protein
MHKRSSTPSRPKRPRDFNQLAYQIVMEATGEAEPEQAEPIPEPEPEPAQPAKNPAAVALGKLGGKKGGKARAAKLSPERRSEIARQAAQARWKKKDG